DSLGDEVRVTVVAAGFDESQQRPAAPLSAGLVTEEEPPVTGDTPDAEESWLLPSEERVAPEPSETPAFAAEAEEDDELDVPEFLR
ncbi:MAG: hypothetical protein VW015_00070, partial [Pontimonas sp.]